MPPPAPPPGRPRVLLGGGVLVFSLGLGLAYGLQGITSMSEPIQLPGLSPFSGDLSSLLRRAAEPVIEAGEARAHHRDEIGRPRFINRLARSNSPYLLQHAFNPVSWFPWGEEAFELARRTGRPILLSVGYATCHWCHVMERESFEDLEIAEVMNTRFVPIKVDREQRPDVDAVYMMATQLVSGGGGWPMTVALTPDLEPFFAGTYFPARDGDRGARVGFLTLLGRLADAWEGDPEKVVSEAGRLTRALAGANRPAPPEGVPGDAVLIEAARFLSSTFDPEHGGFGRAPKFPRPSVYELLLRYHRRTEDPIALRMVAHSLEKICAGGIYDHLAGGFARYSTDDHWLVPHFEKMLYDNAQLSALLVDAWRLTESPSLERTLRQTLDYVLREMRAPEGGFYSATDADSEGVEGKFFVWTPGELKEVLGEARGAAFAKIYGVTDEGNFEGESILHLKAPLEATAKAQGWETTAFLDALAGDRARLLEARSERIPPLLDDKILSEWNAQMIGALAKAGFALGEERYIEAAARAAELIERELRDENGRVLRSLRNGRVGGRAVLEDYAYLTDGLLDLFEATGKGRWLDTARSVADLMIAHFGDTDGGGFFASADDGESLLVRDKPSYDGAQPSGNSVAALALLRLGALTLDPSYGEWADRTLHAFGGLLEKGATANPKLALALDWRLDRAKEILIVRTPSDRGEPLLEVLRETFVPNAVRVIVEQAEVDEVAQRIPWLEGKKPLDSRATAFVCTEGVCQLPTQDPAKLREQLKTEVPFEAPRLELRTRR